MRRAMQSTGRAALALFAGALLFLSACGGPAGSAAQAKSPAAEAVSAQQASAPVQPAEQEPTPAPTPTPMPVFILCGQQITADTAALDLSDLQPAEVAQAVSVLEQLPKLKTVSLGDSTAAGPKLGWKDILRLEQAAPDARFSYTFTLYDRTFTFDDTEMNLSYIPVADEGALVKQVAACMPQLRVLDMDSCGVSDAAMAAIREALPSVKVIWRIWFGGCYSVRTDVEKILASNPDVGGLINRSNCSGLQYCTEVRYLDIGHNDYLGDISFISCMPKLEVAILAMCGFSDTRPIADCPNLEFLEIQTNNITDLTPLAGLTRLRHLNICYNQDLEDITPLYGLTGLERLWIGSVNRIPQAQIEEMQRRAPNCSMNTWCEDPHDGWRTGERYLLLSTQFGYVNAEAHYAYFWNDPLCKGLPE